MIAYLIKSIICLTLLFAFYRLFLEKEKVHQFNRFYLIGILLFSLAVPKYIIYVEPSMVSPINTLSDATANSFQIADYLNYVIGIYLLGVIVLLFRFLRNVAVISKRIKENPKIRSGSATIVLLGEEVLPHTFLNYIFINRDDFEAEKIEEELFTHELTHVKERHTLDILFVELFQIVFWFNPILIFLKRSVRLNHEFIADDTVINSHKNIPEYQHILLDIASWGNNNSLSSNINYSLTKKRFNMMARKSSRLTRAILKISVIPLLTVFVFLFADVVIGQENHEEGHDNKKAEIRKESSGDPERSEGEHREGEEHKEGERDEINHKD
ncbi:hypothetical protein GWK08_09070 [Leptobacterium flavescens]|uniref:Peptidase M56 domain-containing protein n=1 Tax=Leptobacterium flavescens TaxID=472055 RepID=A0A6P0UT67_9FLAO|nr:M56 family metallopeptidase [Leptobacterium flavescens]NER13586.1 hypothetical protein [Leptobacterium flavescens]